MTQSPRLHALRAYAQGLADKNVPRFDWSPQQVADLCGAVLVIEGRVAARKAKVRG